MQEMDNIDALIIEFKSQAMSDNKILQKLEEKGYTMNLQTLHNHMKRIGEGIVGTSSEARSLYRAQLEEELLTKIRMAKQFLASGKDPAHNEPLDSGEQLFMQDQIVTATHDLVLLHNGYIEGLNIDNARDTKVANTEDRPKDAIFELNAGKKVDPRNTV